MRRRNGRQVGSRTDEPALVTRALVHHSPVPILQLDPDGRVRFWNQAAERLSGWPLSRALQGKLDHIARELVAVTGYEAIDIFWWDSESGHGIARSTVTTFDGRFAELWARKARRFDHAGPPDQRRPGSLPQPQP